MLMFPIGASVYGQPAEPTHAASAPASPSVDKGHITDFRAVEPAPSEAIRVGGDIRAQVTFEEGEYRAGPCRIPTPLPVGYPAPTPPGAIEIKGYPLVRRAQVRGVMAPDLGMNLSFWSLFRHISRRQIAMTSPVEMDYEGLDGRDEKMPDRWTMSFLYRTTDDGPRGVDRSVEIVDLPPMTVVSVGFRGSASIARVQEQLATLELWLEQHPEWAAAGDPRALFYNGPEVPERNKWVEVQIPIQPAADSSPDIQDEVSAPDSANAESGEAEAPRASGADSER